MLSYHVINVFSYPPVEAAIPGKLIVNLEKKGSREESLGNQSAGPRSTEEEELLQVCGHLKVPSGVLALLESHIQTTRS